MQPIQSHSANKKNTKTTRLRLHQLHLTPLVALPRRGLGGGEVRPFAALRGGVLHGTFAYRHTGAPRAGESFVDLWAMNGIAKWMQEGDFIGCVVDFSSLLKKSFVLLHLLQPCSILEVERTKVKTCKNAEKTR